MKKKNLIIAGAVALVLIIFSFVSILIFGREGKYNVPIQSFDTQGHEYTDVTVEIEDPGIVEFTGYKVTDKSITVNLYYVSPGKTYFTVHYKDNGEPRSSMNSVYCHRLKIVSVCGRIGNINGSFAAILSLLAYVLFVVISLAIGLRRRIKENLYSYKNALMLSGLIFSAVFFILLLMAVLSTLSGSEPLSFIAIFSSISNIPGIFSLLLTFSLAIIFLAIAISNIQLIRREGAKGRNLLGIIGGFGMILLMFIQIFVTDFIWSNVIVPNGLNGNVLFSNFDSYVPMFIYAVISYFEIMFIGIALLGIASARHVPAYNKDFIIILGCSIAKDGSLLPLIRGRVDRAIEFNTKQKLLTGKSAIYIPSGGKGSDETISEAQAMTNYLISKGVPEEQIIMEDQSANTFQNLQNSKHIIQEIDPYSNVAFSTTNYHVLRSGIYASKVELKAEGMGAKTKWYFWPNAFIREFIALMKQSKKPHIIFCVAAFLVSAALFFFSYFGDMF